MKKTLTILTCFAIFALTAKCQSPVNARFPTADGQPADTRRLRNITAFCKLFGYIRYFHPADETQKIDWERFAIYGSRRVLDATDDTQLLARLKELFHPLAPTVLVFLDTAPLRFDRAALIPPQRTGYKEISWQYTGMSMRLVKDFPRPEHATVRLNRSAWQLVPRHYDTAGQGMAFQYLPAMYNGGRFTLEAEMKIQSSEQVAGEIGLININDQSQGSTYTTPAATSKAGAWKKYQLSGNIDDKCTQLFLYLLLKHKGSLLARNIRFSVVKDGQTYFMPLKDESWGPPPNNNYTLSINKATLNIRSIDSLTLSRLPDSPAYAYRTTVGEYAQKQLVPGITCIVPLAVYGNADHTYPMTAPAALLHLITTVKKGTPAQLTADSLDVRLGDVVLSWNIYRHFFPFWEEASQTPGELLQDAIIHALHDHTEADFFRTLQLITAPLNDEHIFPSFVRDSSIFGMAGISFAVAEEKLVVRDVLDTAAQKKLRPGDIVDSINGITGLEALAATEKYISGAPQGRRNMALYKMPFGYPWSPLQITVHRAADTIRVKMYKTGWMGWHTIIDTLPANGAEVADNIYYINLLEPGEKLGPLLRRVENAKAVIFDIRGYPSYDLFDSIMSRLITEKVSKQSILYDPQIVYPDYEKVKFTVADFECSPRAPHIGCKVYFLSNAAIGSHPEYFLALIKTYKLGTIIGQPTAGVDGTINGFTLPGGFGLTFTGIKVAPFPGTSSHLQGVIPDIPVDPDISSITAGQDKILNEAIKIAYKKGRP